MTDQIPGRPVSGKKVVIYSLLFVALFTTLMGFGTFSCAHWLTPILKERAAHDAKAGTVP